MSEDAEIFEVNDVVEAVCDGGRRYNHYRKGSRWVVEELARSKLIAHFRSLRIDGKKGEKILYIGGLSTAFSDFTKRGTWSENVVRFTP